MLAIRLGPADLSADVLALPVTRVGDAAAPLDTGLTLPEPLRDEITAFLADAEHTGRPGVTHSLARPGRTPRRLLLVGVGDEPGAAQWRAAGAAAARAARREPKLAAALPADPEAVRAFAEGAWLGSYRFRVGADDPATAPALRTVVLPRAAGADAALAEARALVDATVLARDLTNTSSLDKSPSWFIKTVARAARDTAHLDLTVIGDGELADLGFGGLLAVGGGSPRPPRLLRLDYAPPGAKIHVVLVGKGITYDTGGISIKPLDGMKLMRKDMGGAAAVSGATLAAAKLKLGVRVTALAPLAENAVSGSAMRPGDVIRHYGGLTSEIQNTDAEGRLVLADALAYAVAELDPDLIIDVATLTGGSWVALGRRTAALFTPNDDLAAALTTAGNDVGEAMWRLPLADDYVSGLASDIADVTNMPSGPQAVAAALYLREFVGEAADRWAHLDISGPSWIETTDGHLVKGATGWGVRVLTRWLGTL
ncbi:leucyl aminopeptidase [Luedemannella helvata]|uniref:Probable cytosol aminopeptidase n=1 Tax=Luedemannella helvata TaxID=349315 RepID=A0ABN2L0S3_9ACTN